MTDLEKRAHDLAVAVSAQYQKSILDKKLRSGETDLGLDINDYVDNYLHIYEQILKRLSSFD